MQLTLNMYLCEQNKQSLPSHLEMRKKATKIIIIKTKQREKNDPTTDVLIKQTSYFTFQWFCLLLQHTTHKNITLSLHSTALS